MEKWKLFSILALISTTIQVTLLSLINKNVQSISDSFTIVLLMTSLTGIISVFVLIYRYYKNNNLFLVRNKCELSLIPILSTILIINQIGLIIGVSGGRERSLLIVNTNVILVGIISFLFYKEILTIKTIIGIIMALTGVTLVLHDKIK